MSALKLIAVPISLRDANAFVVKHHRHHGPVRGHKLAIGAEWDGELIAIVIIGRPVARKRGDQALLDATRVCTDGVRRHLGQNRRGNDMYVNAASFLYARAHQVASAMGCKIGTYILEDESGISVKAAGYTVTRKTPGKSWDVPSRPREDKHPLGPKFLLERAA